VQQAHSKSSTPLQSPLNPLRPSRSVPQLGEGRHGRHWHPADTTLPQRGLREKIVSNGDVATRLRAGAPRLSRLGGADHLRGNYMRSNPLSCQGLFTAYAFHSLHLTDDFQFQSISGSGWCCAASGNLLSDRVLNGRARFLHTLKRAALPPRCGATEPHI